MNQREARRRAHAAIAALIRVNVEAGEGDLWVGLEDLPDEDLDRFAGECRYLAAQHSVAARLEGQAGIRD